MSDNKEYLIIQHLSSPLQEKKLQCFNGHRKKSKIILVTSLQVKWGHTEIQKSDVMVDEQT